MINACLGQDSRFGVVLIKEGLEVGKPAVPHDVGTIARITRVTSLDEGRMNLITLGERRFRLEEVTQQLPYLKGRVGFFEPEAVGKPHPTPESIYALRARLEEYLRALLGLRGGWVREVNSPTDPVDLSFYIATVLKDKNETLQQILEAPTAVERLDLLSALLSKAGKRTRKELENRMARGAQRLN